MGPTWVLSAPDGPHVGPMYLAIRADFRSEDQFACLYRDTLQRSIRGRWAGLSSSAEWAISSNYEQHTNSLNGPLSFTKSRLITLCCCQIQAINHELKRVLYSSPIRCKMLYCDCNSVNWWLQAGRIPTFLGQRCLLCCSLDTYQRK